MFWDFIAPLLPNLTLNLETISASDLKVLQRLILFVTNARKYLLNLPQIRLSLRPTPDPGSYKVFLIEA